MPAPIDLITLRHAVVSLIDPHGLQARFSVDHVGKSIAICTYVFHGQHAMPLHLAVDDEVGLGAPHVSGWLTAEGRIIDVKSRGTVSADFGPLALNQRRKSYREDLVLPFELEIPGEQTPARGRTLNVSSGGFAGRMKGHPIINGCKCTASFDMPDGTMLEAVCEKVGGEIEQRFRFLTLGLRDEDRIVHLVRAAELERRRTVNRPLI